MHSSGLQFARSKYRCFLCSTKTVLGSQWSAKQRTLLWVTPAATENDAVTRAAQSSSSNLYTTLFDSNRKSNSSRKWTFVFLWPCRVNAYRVMISRQPFTISFVLLNSDMIRRCKTCCSIAPVTQYEHWPKMFWRVDDTLQEVYAGKYMSHCYF